MARFFSYEGDHAEVQSYGLHFPQGVPVAVHDPAAQAKAAGNRHFREHFDLAAADPVVTAAPASPAREKRKYNRKAH